MVFNRQIIEEFRANGGRVGGMFADARFEDEHKTVHGLLEELRRVLDTGDPGSLLAEADRLVTTLHAHLDREEEIIVPLLDAAETASGGNRAGGTGAGGNGG